MVMQIALTTKMDVCGAITEANKRGTFHLGTITLTAAFPVEESEGSSGVVRCSHVSQINVFSLQPDVQVCTDDINSCK